MLSGCFPFHSGKKDKRQNPMKTKEVHQVHPDHHHNHLPAEHIPDQARKTIATLGNQDQEDQERAFTLKKLDKEEELEGASVLVSSAATSANSSRHLIPSPTPSQAAADRKKPASTDIPAKYFTLYVGLDREVFKVPARFLEYKSFLELLEEAERREKESEKSREITEDLGDAVLLDFVSVESFRKVKRSLEWNEKDKKAKEDGYYGPLWDNYFAMQKKKDNN